MNLFFKLKQTLCIGFLCSCLTCIFPVHSYSWTEDIIAAAEAMETGSATEQQQALVLREIDTVNKMRIKGVISDPAYQKSHSYFDQISQETAVSAAKQHGAKLTVQPRSSKVYDAGTDSDYITNATSKEQVVGMQKSYNEKFSEKIRDLGGKVEQGKDWTKKNDVDFMINPDSSTKEISPAEFAEVSKINNDAYVRPDAARFEAKTRSESGEKPTVQETKAYLDEMRDFIGNKRNVSKEYAKEIMVLNKNPQAHKRGTAAYNKRMNLEASLIQSQAQQAKYFSRINYASNVLAEHADTSALAASNLPETAKKRAASDGVTTSKRQINAATAASSADNLMVQGKLNEAILLGIASSRDRTQTAKNNERIANLISDLPPAQQGELMNKLLDSNTVDSNVSQDLKLRLRGYNSAKQTAQIKGTKTTAAALSRLGKAGKAAGFLGNYLSIQKELKNAENGSHLFFNIEENDSETMKNLKRSAVALTELAPVPIIDSLERGWKADERVKREILERIANGEDVDPALVAAEVFAEIGINTVGSMTISPLLSGAKSVEEGFLASRDFFINWQDDAVRAEAEILQKEKMDAIFGRIEAIDLGLISATATSKTGGVSYVLDDVQIGDTIDFTVPRSDRWTNQYKVQWQIKNGAKQVIAKTEFKSASNPSVHKLSHYNNNLPPGRYYAVFRIFNANSNKMMDSTDYGFTVSGAFGMGAISAKHTNGKSSKEVVKHGDKLAFNVIPIGTWDKQTVEWFIDGEILKSGAANTNGITNVIVGLDESYPVGKHTVSVRAKKDKRIIAVKKINFQLAENVDYLARGKKRHKQTITNLVSNVVPTCLGPAGAAITRELLSTPIADKEAFSWGKPKDIGPAQKDYEKEIMREWIQGFPALPEDDCTISYAQLVATKASTYGIGAESDLFAQLKAKLKKKEKQDPALGKCLRLQKSMQAIAADYRKSEDKYLGTITSYLKGTANHPTYQRLASKLQGLSSKLTGLQARGAAAEDKAAYAAIYSEFSSTNATYQETQAEMRVFIDKLSAIGGVISSNTNSKSCQQVVDFIESDAERRSIFYTIVGGGGVTNISGKCSDLLSLNEKYNARIKEHKELQCVDVIKDAAK